jgi:hypothetical protein
VLLEIPTKQAERKLTAKIFKRQDSTKDRKGD